MVKKIKDKIVTLMLRQSTKDELNNVKEHPRETYQDVLLKLLKHYKNDNL